MIKRIFSLLMSLTLLFSLGACSKSSSKGCANHTYSPWTTSIEATCANDGRKERTCSTCGHTETQAIPATSIHSFGLWTTSVEATCKNTGVQTKTCSVCGTTESQSIPVSSFHSTVNGKCTVCGTITDAYDAFVYYVKQNGDYDDGYYTLMLGADVYDGTAYSRHAHYNVAESELSISILWDSDLFLNITIDEYSSIYDYSILMTTSTTYYMFGSFYPNTFSSSTTSLYSSSTNLPTSLKTSVRELGASLAKVLLNSLDDDIKDSGVTAYMLGFINF
ncbi:MAG: hypothetical protein IJX31_01425 [Clostridia bacterium]|nr:hypothetical protein [Clostridia bacterium]